MARNQGGWGFNLDGEELPGPSATDEELQKTKTRPYFRPFLEVDLRDPDPAVASAKAGDANVQYDLLVRGLPALSYAAAVDRVPVLGQERNFDMEVDGRTAGLWPTEGHTKDPKSVGRWLHGDVKNVVLPYLWRMYDAMIERGALR